MYRHDIVLQKYLRVILFFLGGLMQNFSSNYFWWTNLSAAHNSFEILESLIFEGIP